MEIVRIRSGGLHGNYRKFNSAIWFNKLAAHHEEDEKLKNDVDERGHVDPGINTAFSGNHYILDGRSLVAGGVDEVAALFGEEAFAEVRGEFVEISMLKMKKIITKNVFHSFMIFLLNNNFMT